MTSEANELAALHSPDRDALGALHDRYFPELYRYAHYRLGDADEAEDLASETFARLLESVRTGRGPRTSLRGWLYGTLRHLVDDHHRRTYAHPASPLESRDADAGAEILPQIETREQLDAVRQALHTLTPDQQHVLALRLGGEHSLDETAALMRRNPNAIKALQHRALLALRRSLDEGAR